MKTYISLLFLCLTACYCSAQKLLLKGELSDGRGFVLSYDQVDNDHLFYWEDSFNPIPLEVLPVKSAKIALREIGSFLSAGDTDEEITSFLSEEDGMYDLVSCSLYESNEKWNITFDSENYEKVKLQEIKVDELDHILIDLEEVKKLKKEAPFYYLLTSQILSKSEQVVDSKISALNGKKNDLKRISLNSGYSKKSLAMINARVDSIFFSNLYKRLKYKIEPLDFSVNFSISYTNKSFVVLEVKTRTFGIDQVTEFGSDHFVIDTKTGELLYSADFFRYYKGDDIDLEEDPEYGWYEICTANPILEDFTKGTSYGDCSLDITKFYPKEGGLCIPTKRKIGNEECDQDCAVFIPYAEIKDYLSPKYKWRE